MGFFELVAGVAFGRAMTPVARLILAVIGLFILAGIWGVITGAENQP